MTGGRCVDQQLTANNLSVVTARYHRSRAHANDRLTPAPMKIIFSRKGFDSQYGGVPSPILPDGTLLPLPIPSMQGRPLRDIQSPAGPLHLLVSDLTCGKIGPDTLVHLDPDLQSPAIPRLVGWQPSLGQVAAAQGHLARQGVGEGDLFLFFGWYRQAEVIGGRWRYVPEAPDIHSLFGWLQIAAVIDACAPDCAQRYPWLEDHPHIAFANTIGKSNTIYVGAESMLGGRSAGAGVFAHWSERLQLTARGCSRSRWRVPDWMDPATSGLKLSYHNAASRWSRLDSALHLQTVGKGQEFVVDTGNSAAAQDWLVTLMQ